MLFVFILIFVWTFLEATFWWVAPDISISIAYIYFPKKWKRFILVGLMGSFVGSIVTYYWASHFPSEWMQYVGSMRFHSAKNMAYVESTIQADPFIVIKGAWGGLPYKLFIGFGAIKQLPMWGLIGLGILSRCIRFLFVLWVTSLIRSCAKSFSARHPAKMSMVLLLIWSLAITLFDVGINRFLL